MVYKPQNQIDPNKPKVITDRKIGSSNPVVAVSPVRTENIVEKKSIKTIILLTISALVKIVMDMLETVVVGASIFVVVYLFIIQPHEVKGASMEPSFYNNEFILTDKISYRFKEPQRGDVVIFKSPVNPSQDYIKRIIGLSGDKIKVESGNIYVNDELLYEPYLRDKTFLTPGSYLKEGVDIIVPENHLFMMGDNRPHSSDSRDFGPVPKDSIRGRAMVRYWPPARMGLISHISYSSSSQL